MLLFIASFFLGLLSFTLLPDKHCTPLTEQTSQNEQILDSDFDNWLQNQYACFPDYNLTFKPILIVGTISKYMNYFTGNSDSDLFLDQFSRSYD